jgi:uroporphyrin-III C-methyltransferase
MRSVRARLADVADAAHREGLGAPAVVVVGAVAALDLLA